MIPERLATVRVDQAAVVWAGEGALSRVVAAVEASPHAGATVVVTDENLTRARGGRETVSSTLPVISWTAHASLDNAARLAGLLRDDRVQSVIAVGGGGLLDMVKLASVHATDPRFLGDVENAARNAGAVVLDPRSRPGIRIIAAPTTLGTGSESNAVAIVMPVGDGIDRTLVSCALMRPAESVLDPALTSSLSARAIREGLVEILVRVVGATSGTASSLRIAERHAGLLARESSDLLDAAAESGLSSDDLLHAALLSGESHVGWTMVGRGASPSPLWVVAHELASVLGERKIDATLRLAPAVLAHAADDDRAWGTRSTLRTAVDGSSLGHALFADDPLDRATRLRHLFSMRWQLPVPEFVGDAGAVGRTVAERMARRWPEPLAIMRRLDPSQIARLVEEALAPR